MWKREEWSCAEMGDAFMCSPSTTSTVFEHEIPNGDRTLISAKHASAKQACKHCAFGEFPRWERITGSFNDFAHLYSIQ
jgi:hypothetical protein